MKCVWRSELKKRFKQKVLKQEKTSTKLELRFFLICLRAGVTDNKRP